MDTSEDMFDMLVGRKTSDSQNISPTVEEAKKDSLLKRKRLSISDSEESAKQKKTTKEDVFQIKDSDSDVEVKPKKKIVRKKQKIVSDDSISEADLKPKKKPPPKKKQKKQTDDSDSEVKFKPKKRAGKKKQTVQSDDSDFEVIPDSKTKKKKADSENDDYAPPMKSTRAPRNTKPTKYVLSGSESD